MLISNLRNKGDLEAKKRLRDDLLELEANNEAELDKRVKDYKNPNKPIPVAPQYKSANEMRKDRLNQEKEAIKNFADLGLDYADGAEMISWLSSSLIDKLVEFNANFKGIKKELVETTNPKLITTDFLKNYLERYFEDLDVSFGRKFATKGEQMETLKTTEELERIVPTKEILSSLRTILIEENTAMRKLINTNEEQIRRNLSVFTTERDAKIYRETREKEILIIRGLLKKNYVNTQLLMLYDDILPSNEFIGLLKSSLTQKDRSDLIRRYLAGLKSVNMLSVEGIDELLKEYDENSGVGYTYNANVFINKVSKALSFLLDDGKITKITKLVRDYENIIKTYEGREIDLENIKRFIAMNEAKIAQQKALINETLNREVNSFDKEGEFMGEYKEGIANVVATDRALRKRTEEGMDEFDRLMEAEEDRGRALAEIEERKENEGISQLNNRLKMELEDKRAKKIREKLKNRGIGIREYYKEFLKEIEDFYLNSHKNRGRTKAQVITDLKKFLVEDLGFSKVEVRNNQSPKLKTDEYFYSLWGMLSLWIEENRINAYEDDASFNYNRPTKIPTLGGTQMSYGVGLRENIKIRQIKSPMLDFERKFSENKSVSSARSVSGGEIKFQHSRIKVGSGISVKQTPNYKTFGKYVIHLGHLADRNVANFKYPSLGSIPHIKPLTISEEYKEFILDTLDNGRPNERLLKNLSMEEQKHFEKVCLGAGLLDTFKIKRGNTEEEKKAVDRFNVLRGEVLAGNNNEKVIKELKLLIIKLMNDGKLNKNEATNMLIELSVL
jgi:hypothetical protein